MKMPLIEGVGDEVVQFAVVVLVVVVAMLAWWSTNARPNRYRTVLVMRSRAHPVTVNMLSRTNVTTSQNTNQASTSTAVVAGNVSSNSVTRDNRVIPLQEMDSIVDADMAMLDNHRLHFYRRIHSPPSNQTTSENRSEENESLEEPEPASSDQIREMNSIVSAMEADAPPGCTCYRRNGGATLVLFWDRYIKPNANKEGPKKEDNENIEPTSGNGEQETAGTSVDDTPGESRILIKLKYLNDTLKEVEGSLDEPLKDFKRRHFAEELCSERVVRLIFRGRVLGDEAATLRACGLHHRAVVHCLVHPKRQRPAQQTSNPTSVEGQSVGSEAAPERSWDLENILMTLVSIALTIVWFFRCEYSNMFTASASVALFGLTVFYSVAIFGLYLSDSFYFERRPAQPVANN
ncbi:transmembrane and ubiquitin-like domain-containing protein 1 isoform X1 [Danaus plexippus]|uniref:transmembrane and ubiquitin-like domain-containing protein 1 isoform X1 n=1 Tax=Danaus plexippus TaxID=13037 RepID=UPI002AB1A1CE|nr:transmembrane and ubiquitin-like domain-containing protein 1 isoform X1 [Danaus plexippus]